MPKISVEMRKNGFDYRINDDEYNCPVKNRAVKFSSENYESIEYELCVESVLKKRHIIDIVAAVLIILMFAIDVIIKQIIGLTFGYQLFAILGCSIILVAKICSLFVYCKLEYKWDKTILGLLIHKDQVLSDFFSCSKIKKYEGKTVVNCPKKMREQRIV